MQSINGRSVVGSRHYEVARRLREVPLGEEFTLELVTAIKG